MNAEILWIQEYYEYRHVMNAEILWIQEYYEYRNNMNAEILWIKKYYECRHVNYNYRRIINTNILYYKYNHKWVQIRQKIIIEKNYWQNKKKIVSYIHG